MNEISEQNAIKNKTILGIKSITVELSSREEVIAEIPEDGALWQTAYLNVMGVILGSIQTESVRF